MTLDYPAVRSALICPCCNHEKESGLIVCWACYRTHGGRHGLERFHHTIATLDARLARMSANERARHNASAIKGARKP